MNQAQGKIKVGISSCLLGEEVRYNGSHKYSALCTRDLSRHFDFVPVCPEVSIGLGVPRQPIRLVGNPREPDVVGVDNPDHNVTQPLMDFARTKVKELGNLCGYIFIEDSPSCGLFRVKVYNDKGIPQQESGRGVYARVVTDTFPQLPVEEDGRLQDDELRENFITRVFAYRHWQDLCQGGLTASKIIAFHSRYQSTLLALNPQSCTELDGMLADVGNQDAETLGEQYFAVLMASLTR